ncbi:glycosyltransferase [Bacteroides sp.]|uniref:glycosyltransferase family 4 protein n=1 Tax=Bacteroides sp. TaxID=29523 RepID=UPI002603E78E|nr:glycosyltransferase [Bacteroides sp.]
MKILWITNTLLPPLAEICGKNIIGSGGWMYASLQALQQQDPTLQFAVATMGGKGINLKEEINGITYYLLPFEINPKTYNSSMEVAWRKVRDDFQPNVIHIHGSEYIQGLAYIRGCSNKHVVLSIQGIISVIQRYITGGLTPHDAWDNLTLKEFFKAELRRMPEHNQKRTNIEIAYFKEIQHVIGRTSWDKCHTLSVNPKLNYHFCNETLRDAFEGHKWSPYSCERHSIFISQGMSPLKGMHKIIEALPFILRYYPNAQVYVAGKNITSVTSLKELFKLSAYANYLRHLIRKFDVSKHIHFCGILTAEQMAQRYLNSNVFVCPSSIENSPNSLGEAQLLGVPCVSSFVGGVPDFVEDGKTGLLYRFEETEMMADCICRIFANDQFAIQLSNEEQKVASVRHNKKNNALETIKIYSEIANEK